MEKVIINATEIYMKGPGCLTSILRDRNIDTNKQFYVYEDQFKRQLIIYGEKLWILTK